MTSSLAKSRKGLQAPVLQTVETSLGQFLNVWDEIGINDGQKRERLQVVQSEIQTLLDEMMTEEQELKARLQESADQCRRDYVTLAEQMGVAIELPKKGSALLLIEAELRRRCDRLSKERHERLKSLRALQKEEQLLCECMRLEPVKKEKELSTSPNGIPSPDQIHQLSVCVEKLREQKAERSKRFMLLRQRIVNNWQSLDYAPDKSGDEFHCAVASSDVDRFVLSLENIRLLEQLNATTNEEVTALAGKAEALRGQLAVLWQQMEVPVLTRQHFLLRHAGCRGSDVSALTEEVQRMKDLKRDNLQQLVEKARTQLYELWDKCYFGRDQRKQFVQAFDDSYNEEILSSHEEEIEKLNQYLAENKTLYQLVDKREELWKQKMQFDHNADDPSRYTNRGGKLLKEERERRQVEKDLPKIEKELRDAVIKWEAEQGKMFLVRDRQYLQFISEQWQNRKHFRDELKMKKQEQRKAYLQEELTFGSKPTTPLKRRHCFTPGSASKAKRKVEASASMVTMATSRRFIHSSLKGTLCQSPVAAKKTPKKLTRPVTRSMTKRHPLQETTMNTTFATDPVLAKGGAGHSIISIASSVSYSDFHNGLQKGCFQDTSHSCATSKAHRSTAV